MQSSAVQYLPKQTVAAKQEVHFYLSILKIIVNVNAAFCDTH